MYNRIKHYCERIFAIAIAFCFICISCTTGCPRRIFFQMSDSIIGPRTETFSLSACEGGKINLSGNADCREGWATFIYINIVIINNTGDTLILDCKSAHMITAYGNSISFSDAYINDSITLTPIQLRPDVKESILIVLPVDHHQPRVGMGYPYKVQLGDLYQMDGNIFCSLPPFFIDRPLYKENN